MDTGRKLFISFFIVVAIILFGGCVSEKGDIDLGDRPEFDGTFEFNPLERVLKTMRLTGVHENTEEYRVHCTSDSPFYLTIYELNTDSPYALWVNTKAYCDPPYIEDNYWTLNCECYDNFGFPWYYVHFDISLDQQSWEGEPAGWFYWSVIGGEDFWCTLTYGIVDMELEYVDE